MFVIDVIHRFRYERMVCSSKYGVVSILSLLFATIVDAVILTIKSGIIVYTIKIIDLTLGRIYE